MKTFNILILSIGLAVMPVYGQGFQQIAPQVPSKNSALDNSTSNSTSQNGTQAPAPPQNATPAVPASTPPHPAKKQAGSSSALLLPKLKGLVFVSSSREVRIKGVPGVVGVKADGVPLLQKDEFQTVTAKYIGQPLHLNDLNQLVHDVIVYYKNHDRPIVDVSVPEQDITSGVVQIVAVEGRLGKVRVEGNHWFSTSDLAGDIRLHPNDPISGRIITEDAIWLNTNPFRQVDLVYAPGSQPGTTDIVLKAQDRFPLRAYIGYENNGNQYTGITRLLAGFNWGNAFGLDQQINYQYTMADQYNLYNGQSGSWIIPLPWRHTLTFFGSYSQSRPNSSNPLFTQNGYSWQVSGRYTIPLPETPSFTEELVGGFDFKRSNSDVFFGGAPVFLTIVDVDQFMAGYNASLVDHYGSTSVSSSFFFSPGGLSQYNHTPDFEASQAGANPHYYYFNDQINRITKLPFDFSLATKIIGQVSSGTLIGSEQFGLGGTSTVRGYDERGVNGDSGILISHELRTPPVSIGQFLGIAGATDQLQFLGFIDAGAVTNNKVITGPTSSSTLIGAGPGVRYLINPYFSFRCDYGIQLRNANIPGDTSHSYVELGAILSY